MVKDKLKYSSAVVIFGTIGLILNYVNFSSEFVVMCRGIIGTLTILLVFLVQGRKIDFSAVKRNIKTLIISGVSLGLNWIFLFAAYRTTTVAIASLCNYMAPIIVIAISPFVFKEKLTVKKALCVIAAFAGIVMVSGVLNGDAGNFNLKGVILGLAAALGFVSIVICNKKCTDIDPLERTVVQLAVSAITVAPFVVFNQWGKPFEIDTTSVVLTLVLGIVHTGLAYIFYFSSMAKISVHSVALIGYFEPIVSVLTSALILHEPITAWGIAGAVLILGAAVCSEITD